MYIPKRIKYKKLHKQKIKGSELKIKAITLQFGDYGLQALENGRINPKQIEAARRVIVRKTNRLAKLWIRIFPNTPVTAKPEAVRMGKGKGAVDYWIFKVHSGRILFELTGVPYLVAKEAFKAAAQKLPINVQVVCQLINQ
jgi:large subunit ribosomal protein L16